jgi:hypothetical protein
MGLVPSSIKLLIKTHKKVRFRGPVLTLGNQDVYATYNDLKSFFQRLDCPYSKSEVIPSSQLGFTSLGPPFSSFVHARTLFGMMGIDDYCDIDKFDREPPMILHDMNLPVPDRMVNRFNLILDGGTIEHIFDVRQVMWNIVQMCKISGWVVHTTPVSNFIDHGLYCMSPTFFYDFYTSNGFGECVSYLLQQDVRKYPLGFLKDCPYLEFSYGMNVDDVIDHKLNTVIFFAAKKLKTYSEVQIPNQGFYEPEKQKLLIGNASQNLPPLRLIPAALRPYWNQIRPYIEPVLPLVHGIRKLFRRPRRRMGRI